MSINFIKAHALVRNLVKSPSFLPSLNVVSCQYSVKANSRKKLPPQEKATAKWTTKKTVAAVDEGKVDKHIAMRTVTDPVWLINEYKPQVLKIEDAIQYHKEIASPEMLDNMDGFLNVRLVLDMHGKKKGKFLDNLRGIVYYPNYFTDGIKKEVVAICKNEAEIQACKEAGALHAGHSDVLSKFEKGEITDQSYDIIVCTPETFPDVMLLKKKINKDRLPSLKTNTVVENIGEAVKKFCLSKDYSTSKISDDKALLKAKIGLLNFGTDHLAQNLGSLIEKIVSHKSFAPDSFITDCVLYAPPSTEKFKVDISRLIPQKQEEKVTKPSKQAKKAKEEEEDEEEESTTEDSKN